MSDQAQKLRDLVSFEKPRARVVSITSGKGGVGKTNISVALALALTALKKKVALIDFDLGLANANVLLQFKSRWNLSHYLSGQKSLADILVKGPGGLVFLPGSNGVGYLADIDHNERCRLLKGLETVERTADYILIDTGAGISKNVLTFAAHANDVILVTTPEPTSILDVYSLIRNLSQFPDYGQMHLLVNQVAHREVAAQVADRISHAAESFLSLTVEKMGYVLLDPQVSLSVQKRRSFILDNPRSPASHCIEVIARNLTQLPQQNNFSDKGFFSRLFSEMGSLFKRKAG